MSLAPASGIGTFYKHSTKVIRFVRHGCTNREFFHIVVAEQRKEQFSPVIEQLGSYDPMPNERNEKLMAFNFERIRYWMGEGAEVTHPVAEILGIAGFFPIHPRHYMEAWRNRAEKEKLENEKAEKELAEKTLAQSSETKSETS